MSNEYELTIRITVLDREKLISTAKECYELDNKDVVDCDGAALQLLLNQHLQDIGVRMDDFLDKELV